MDQRYSLQPTSYGGRGLFATSNIPKDSLLLTCEAPYAYAVHRNFRKEVCHYCFAYAFDSRRNTWNIRYEAQPGLGGFYFCSEGCREGWDGDLNVDGLLGLMHAAIDKATKTMKKQKFGPAESSPLEKLVKEAVTPELLDSTWAGAEKTYSKTGAQIPFLDEFELDVTRFLTSVLVRRYEEDNYPLVKSAKETLDGHTTEYTTTWRDFLELQNNELPHVRSRPLILDCHTRIYGFLRKIALPALSPYLETSSTVRTALGKESGNAFGLWETSTEGDREMFGWGSYVSASFFNHDCHPNIRRERRGRNMLFYTVEEVKTGEEVCISYVDVENGVTQRKSDLLDNWYFNCGCRRCQADAIK